MRSFTLQLQDGMHQEEIHGVTSFVGEDASGSFGILAGHARMMTTLSPGLARFRIGDGQWQFVAMSEGVLYFQDDRLRLGTHRYLVGTDYERISDALREQLLAEESSLHAIKQSLHRMDEALFKRLWESGRERG